MHWQPHPHALNTDLHTFQPSTLIGQAKLRARDTLGHDIRPPILQQDHLTPSLKVAPKVLGTEGYHTAIPMTMVVVETENGAGRLV